MNLFRKKETQTTDFEKLFNNFDIKKFLGGITDIENEQDKIEVLINLTKMLTDYLSYREPIYNILIPDARVENTVIVDILKGIYFQHDFNYPETQRNEEVPVRNLNLVVNPWKTGRVLTNMYSINQDNVLKPVGNIVNSYLFPLDIVVCKGGNHSQLSAMLHNEGTTQITTEVDLTSLYDKVYFNGTTFIYNSVKVKFQNENKYRNEEKELLIITGLLFELGRIKKDIKNYPYSINDLNGTNN